MCPGLPEDFRALISIRSAASDSKKGAAFSGEQGRRMKGGPYPCRKWDLKFNVGSDCRSPKF